MPTPGNYGTLSDAALQRARASFRAELDKKQPVRSWKVGASLLVALSLGLAALIATFGLLFGAFEGRMLEGRIPTVVVTAASGALCAFAAMAPRRRTLRWAGVFAAGVSALALILARSGEALSPPTDTPWLCTVSHLGVALAPLVAAVVLLRGISPQPLRAVVAGLAVGCTGALLGEIGCGQDGLHVLAYHLPAWALVTVACVFVSSRMKRRSFAP